MQFISSCNGYCAFHALVVNLGPSRGWTSILELRGPALERLKSFCSWADPAVYEFLIFNMAEGGVLNQERGREGG